MLDGRELYSMKEIAFELCIHPRTLNSWRKQGKFPEPAYGSDAKRGERFVRWTRAQLQEWLIGRGSVCDEKTA